MKDKSPQAKTPAKKNRKSLPNTTPSKENGSAKTPKKNAQAPFPLTPFVKAGNHPPATASDKKKNAATPKNVKTPKQNLKNTPQTALDAPVETPSKAANNVNGKQKQKQLSPAAQNGASPTGKQQKRKQSLAAANDDEASSPKQAKLEKFSGTSNLDQSTTKLTKSQQKKAKKEKRKARRTQIREAFKTLKEGGQVTPDFSSFVDATVKKMGDLEAQQKLSKTALKRLHTYRKLQRLINRTSGGEGEKQQKASAPKKQKQQKQIKKEKKEKPIVKKGDTDEDEGSEEEEENDVEEESEVDDDVEDESSEEESDVDESTPKPVVKGKQKKEAKSDNNKTNKTRYVLFVGNLPFNASKEEITEHFSKVAKVKDFRLVDGKGFGHIEFADRESYEKALSLNHTFIKNRRINVQYSKPSNQNGKQNVSKEIKKKNFKLQGMRKKGMLAGSVKEEQKRSARRAKKTAQA